MGTPRFADVDSIGRLYELVTDDLAIEDTIYILGKALDKERINLDVFLKVRCRSYYYRLFSFFVPFLVSAPTFFYCLHFSSQRRVVRNNQSNFSVAYSSAGEGTIFEEGVG